MFGVVVARVAMATIKKARAGFTILRSFSIRNFSTLPCTIYNTPLGGWWCSGFLLGFLRRRSGVRFPYPPVLEKCAKGFAYAIIFG